MTTEEKLKELILKRYHSIREFTISIDIPYTTMDSIFRRGIGNSSVTNVIKICKALKISVDALADGEIEPLKERSQTSKDISESVEVNEILDDTKDRLTHYGSVTLNGIPIGKAGIESIIDAIDVGVGIAEKKTKS